jgi:hypothetical protein
MADRPPKLSLSRHGMQRGPGMGSLACPKGGNHTVEEGELAVLKARGGGSLPCSKCGAMVPVAPR